MVHREGGDSRIWATREPEPRLPGPTWGRSMAHAVARGSGSIAAPFAAVNLDLLLPPPGAQLIQIGPELDCDLATFGARASKIIVEQLRKCGSWPPTAAPQRSCWTKGLGAWAPPRDVPVRYDFGANAAAQVRRLAVVNVVLQRRRIGKTYFVATSGKR
jgi:hypothetical protein